MHTAVLRQNEIIAKYSQHHPPIYKHIATELNKAKCHSVFLATPLGAALLASVYIAIKRVFQLATWEEGSLGIT